MAGHRFGWTDAGFAVSLYATARLVSAVFLVMAGAGQVALSTSSSAYHVSSPTPASPGYWLVTTNWDGQWYRTIATTGYPTTLPVAGGHVSQSALAFYPLYPMLVRWLMALTGEAFDIVAPVTSTVLGAAAMVVLYRLLRQTSSRFVAGASLATLAFFVASPVLQVAYTESAALLLIVVALSLLRAHRYLWLAAVLLLLGLTRPVAAPLVLVIGVHLLVRWRRRGADPLPRSEVAAGATALAAAGASVALWPATVAALTGSPFAYFSAEAAWHTNGSVPSALGSLGDPSARLFGVLWLLVLGAAALALYASRRHAWGLEASDLVARLSRLPERGRPHQREAWFALPSSPSSPSGR